MEEKPAFNAVHTYSGHTCGCPSMAFTASPMLVDVMSTLATISSLRRSTASASVPPTNEHTITGPSCARLSRPTCNDEPVSRKICSDDATIVSWRPKNDTSCPVKSSRYSRDSCMGETSSRTLFRGLPLNTGVALREGLLDGLDDLDGLGFDGRVEPSDDVAPRSDDELLEVPTDVACVPAFVGDVDELVVERVAVVAV